MKADEKNVSSDGDLCLMILFPVKKWKKWDEHEIDSAYADGDDEQNRCDV